MKTLEERQAILNKVIIGLQKLGWTITSKTDTTCQLTKAKKPETCLVVLLIFLFVIPGILYLIFIKGNMTVFVEVNQDGVVKCSSKDLSPYEISEFEKSVSNIQIGPGNVILDEKPTDSLGLLTIKSIASGLGIAETEVINLIDSGQLKGKKIGESYFVRKEDFDEYMKN